MSTQTAAEIQADMAQGGVANQIIADEALARQMLYEQFKANKKKNKAVDVIYRKNKAEAKKVAEQIVRPSAPPQNLILTHQNLDPGTPAVATGGAISPGAEYNAGIDPDMDLFYDESPPVAVTAVQQAQLVLPHHVPLEVALHTSERGVLSATTVVPPEYLAGRRPAVITDEEYQKRENYSLYPNKFLRREYNDPYEPYLNKVLWIRAGVGYWKFEPNMELHPGEIRRQADAERNASEAKGPQSKTSKLLEQRLREIRKAGRGGAGGKSRGDVDTTANMFQHSGQGGWNGQRQNYVRSHLARHDQMIELDSRRIGQVEGDRGAENYFPEAPPMKKSRPTTMESYIRSLNPQGIAPAPANSVANDFPEAPVVVQPIIPEIPEISWDAPVPYDPRFTQRATEPTAEQEERMYIRHHRKQEERRRHQEESIRLATADRQKIKNDMLAMLGL